MSRKTDSGLSLNSLHEAGHAVTLLILGKRFASVEPHQVGFGGHPSDGYNLPLMCQLAGACAENIGGGLDGWSHSQTDAERAREAAARDLRKRGETITAESVGAEMQAAWDTLRPLLAEYWPAIEAIANQLETTGEVSYGRCCVLLEDAKKTKRFEEARMRVFIGESDKRAIANREANQ